MHYENITAADLITRMRNDDLVLFDGRSPADHAAGHIGNAQALTDAALKKLIVNKQKHRPVVIYCYHGVSSVGLCQLISGLGFSQVYNLEGGWEAWTRYLEEAA